MGLEDMPGVKHRGPEASTVCDKCILYSDCSKRLRGELCSTAQQEKQGASPAGGKVSWHTEQRTGRVADAVVQEAGGFQVEFIIYIDRPGIRHHVNKRIVAHDPVFLHKLACCTDVNRAVAHVNVAKVLPAHRPFPFWSRGFPTFPSSVYMTTG